MDKKTKPEKINFMGVYEPLFEIIYNKYFENVSEGINEFKELYDLSDSELENYTGYTIKKNLIDFSNF